MDENKKRMVIGSIAVLLVVTCLGILLYVTAGEKAKLQESEMVEIPGELAKSESVEPREEYFEEEEASDLDSAGEESEETPSEEIVEETKPEEKTDNSKPLETAKPEVTKPQTESAQSLPSASEREEIPDGPAAPEQSTSSPQDNTTKPNEGNETQIGDPGSAPVREINCEHSFEKVYWYGNPNCGTDNNYYNLICSKCGENGGDGTDKIPHTMDTEETIVRDGCILYTVRTSKCSICGYLGETIEIPAGEDHDWVEAEADPYWDDALQDFVVTTISYCSRCYKHR